MKIYTKKGDAGQTDLIGKRVSKADLRIEINGTIDEATAYISFAKSFIKDQEILKILSDFISKLHLASYEIALAKKPQITPQNVLELEELIDYYNERLEPLKKFVYFDNKQSASVLNIARTIIRKVERLLVALNIEEEVSSDLLKYFNRLSDLLFILARVCEEL